MITNEMWQRAKEFFENPNYKLTYEVYMYDESRPKSRSNKSILITRKQVEEHFKANDTPRHEVSVKKNECPECFGTVVAMSDGSEYCCDCDYSINTNPCHSGDTKPNIDDLIKFEAMAFTEWCVDHDKYARVRIGSDDAPLIWIDQDTPEDENNGEYYTFTTEQLYQIYLASKNKK